VLQDLADVSPQRHEEHQGHKGVSIGLSYAIIGSAIEVHRLLGPGLLESVYEIALCRELWLRGISVERQVSVPVNYKGEILNCEVKLDLLVEKHVVVEVKAVEKLIAVHTAQLLTYLRLQDLWLGLLINFNVNFILSDPWCSLSLRGKRMRHRLIAPKFWR
jgi:GxxExxY protein